MSENQFAVKKTTDPVFPWAVVEGSEVIVRLPTKEQAVRTVEVLSS